MFIATLIAKDRLAGGDISAAADALAAPDRAYGRSWIEEDKACDLLFSGRRRRGAGRRWKGLLPGVDVVVQGEARPPQAAARRRHGFDDDRRRMHRRARRLCRAQGRGGGGDRAGDARRDRVRGGARRAGRPARRARRGGIDRCHDRAGPAHARRRGAGPDDEARRRLTLLVSGGFTRFADRVGAEIGFDRVDRQRLARRGREAGAARSGGRSSAPRASARRCSTPAPSAAIAADEALAVGDGANDIPMLKEAGLGVAYHAKPAAAAAADARIEHERPHRPALRPGLCEEGVGGIISRFDAGRAGSCRRRSRRGRRRPRARRRRRRADAVVGERADLAAIAPASGWRSSTLVAERGRALVSRKAPRGRDVAQRGGRGMVGDQHAHPPPPPARRHARLRYPLCRRAPCPLPVLGDRPSPPRQR